MSRTCVNCGRLQEKTVHPFVGPLCKGCADNGVSGSTDIRQTSAKVSENSCFVEAHGEIEIQIHHVTGTKRYLVVHEECGQVEREDGSEVFELVLTEEEEESKSDKDLLQDCLDNFGHLCVCPACIELCERLRNALGERSRNET